MSTPQDPNHPDTPAADPSHGGQALQGQGTWFDGKSTQRHAVHLLLIDDVLRLSPDVSQVDQQPRRYNVESLDLSEPFDATPQSITLPDGGTVWVDEADKPLADAVFDRANGKRQGIRRTRVHRLIASWPAVVACLLVTASLLAWYDRQGASLVARGALAVLPTSIDQAVGDAAWASIDERWFKASQVPKERQARMEARFNALVARLAPDRKFTLLFKREARGGGDDDDDEEEEEEEEDEGSSAADANKSPTSPDESSRGAPANTDSESKRRVPMPEGGFNAFALPNGTVVVLDGLANTLTDDELMVVLGHEVGHVVHRHSMQQAARAVSLLAVANVVVGDFSSILASTISTLQTFKHSREAELESDAYGRRWAQAAGLPAGTEASVWRKFKAVIDDAGVGDLPGWMSTHPSTDERLRAAEGGEVVAPPSAPINANK